MSGWFQSVGSAGFLLVWSARSAGFWEVWFGFLVVWEGYCEYWGSCGWSGYSG